VSNIANSPLAASDVAKAVFGEKGSIVVTIIAVFSIISVLNAYMMMPSRILYGMSRDGFFIKKGTIINNAGTPIVTLLVSSLFAFILIYIGTFEVLFLLSTFMAITVWGLTYVSLIKLRFSEPNLERPYKSWGYPYTSILMIVFSIALFTGFAYSDSKSFLAIVGITLLSYPIFLLLKPKSNKE
jgi:APA family basic amino acid/polyamine antiporter